MTRRAIPERVMELLCRLAGTAYHIGRRGADAPGPENQDLADAVPRVEPPIREAERGLQELVAGAIGSAVVLAFEEARSRGYIGWRPRSDEQMNAFIEVVADQVIHRPFVVEATIIPKDEIQ